MKDYKLSVDKYQGILKSIDLEEISIRNFSVKTDEAQFGKEYKLSIKSKFDHRQEENRLTFYFQFTLSAQAPDKEKAAIKIIPQYKIWYSKNPETQIDPEFFEIFPEASLKFIVWPYFRELVQNTISRMNLPPLVLPTIM